ncbi:hypothetical protein NHH03_22435 [Stieleria sp. TO1_6]|uniref:hypothetical protein n=1 Tax=Stieleria tagensis TaxID=2956795 RepID=UPI00209B6918|nr:hypothetical protein [Stieleria tagensis]MCO8124514.1 hypothetical protein [Stieleria tagensis]
MESEISDPLDRSSGSRFARVWSIGAGVLVLVTLPLWVTLPAWDVGYPRVSWLPWSPVAGVALVADSMALIVSLASLAAIAIGVQRRWLWWLVAAGLAASVLLDQHRLQPWAYQTILYGIVMGGLGWRSARPWIMAIAISVYFYSASGKIDFQFVHTVGNQMIHALAVPVGGVSDALATRLAFVLPISELLVALLLMLPLTRKLAGCGAIAMHVTLVAILGPWALDHSWGVLAWNILLAAQSWVLFVRPDVASINAPTAPSTAGPTVRPAGFRWAIAATVLFALLAPLGERFGYWDHWTSWALYSPHNSRAEIEIHQSAIDRLPPQAKPFLGEDADADRWHALDAEQWSLQWRLAPIYPQARYQLELALALAEQAELQRAIRVEVKGVSDRWSGKRKQSYLIGEEELRRAVGGFWL